MQRSLTEREMFQSDVQVFPCISLSRTCDCHRGLQTKQPREAVAALPLSLTPLSLCRPGRAHGLLSTLPTGLLTTWGLLLCCCCMRMGSLGLLLLFPQQKQNAEHPHSHSYPVPGQWELLVLLPGISLSTLCVFVRGVLGWSGVFL